MKYSRVKDEIEIANIYQKMLNEDMTSGGVFGGSSGAMAFADVGGNTTQSVYGGTSGEINLTKTGNYGDDDDARNPYGLGITTRNGALNGRGKKKGKKKRKAKKG